MKESQNDSEVMSQFKMEDILAIPRGQVQEYTTPMPDRKGKLKLVITDHLGVVDGIMIAENPTKPLTHYNDRPMVEMNFMLQGSISQTQEGLLNRYPYQKGYHNILFNPYSMESNQLMQGGTHRIFSAHIEPNYMATLFAGYLPQFAPLADKISKGERFVLHAPANGLNNRLRSFFDTFWQYPETASLRKLYFDTRVMDLLCLQCELLMGNTLAGNQMDKADMDKIYYARDIVLSQLHQPPTLAELSRLCSLNEFKLKKYFKQVFGTSVFAMVQDERLKAAKQLIYQGEKNISMIAYELGYAHPQHFQRAFKKRFGITPTELLK